uniref:RING-type E3 ubiquitin transferase n=1 Tax=Colobus angolensis palliatus TaxID=336983 RepID=A0A2K5HDV4_COLAP
MAEAAAPRPTVTSSGAGVAAAVAAAASPTRILTVPSVPGGRVTCRYFMRGVCKEGDNCCYLHDLSDSLYNIVCKYFQRGYCIYGDCCIYEHSKSLKQEEATATELTTKSSLAASSSEAESRNSNFATVRAGSEDWVNAIEFVPGQLYYGCTAPSCTEAPLQGSVTKEESVKEQTALETKKQLWPYAAVGERRYQENCVYVHGDSCDMCGLQVLHPMDAGQRPQHIKSCTEAHEKDMELSFAVQRSKEIVCRICMEHRFGILASCSRTYCLRCIRKWRSAKQFESKIIKSCPECRITSNFVIPSEYWVEEEEEKQKLIVKYKEAMSNKACRYFDERHESCPFGGNCFYKHVYPDGHREEPQRQKVGTSSRYPETENSSPFDNDEEELVTFELGELLLMLLATYSEDEWDLFHEELEDFYDLDL